MDYSVSGLSDKYENFKSKKLYDIWTSQGKKYKNNLACIKDNNEDRYMICVSSKYGNVGDKVTVNLNDGTKLKCVVFQNSDNVDGIVEFKSANDTIIKYGDLNQSEWNLEFDVNSKVVNVKKDDLSDYVDSVIDKLEVV